LPSFTSGWGSSPRSYVAPDGTYTASPAPLWRRGLASAIDWLVVGLLYLLLLIPLGLVEGLGRTIGGPAEPALFWLSQAVSLSLLGGYFTSFLMSGHTLGMRALDIHVFSSASGRSPGPARALVRSVLAVVLAAATLNAYLYLTGRPLLGEFSSLERTVAAVAIPLALAGLLGQLWLLLDPQARTVWDRLTGLVVVEEVVPTSMPDRLWSPWGT
jgi:uncharacterized RDD family membrane protein YckC